MITVKQNAVCKHMQDLGHYPYREIQLSAGGHPSFVLSGEHLLDCLTVYLFAI